MTQTTRYENQEAVNTAMTDLQDLQVMLERATALVAEGDILQAHKVVEDAWRIYRDYRLKPILDGLTRASRATVASTSASQSYEGLALGHWTDLNGDDWLLSLPWNFV